MLQTASGPSGRDSLLAREDDTIDFDEVFTHHIGEMGRYQAWLFAIASAPWFPGAFLTYNLAFAGALYQFNRKSRQDDPVISNARSLLWGSGNSNSLSSE